VVNATPKRLYPRGRDPLHTVAYLKLECTCISSTRATRSGIQRAIFIKLKPNSTDANTRNSEGVNLSDKGMRMRQLYKIRSAYQRSPVLVTICAPRCIPKYFAACLQLRATIQFSLQRNTRPVLQHRIWKGLVHINHFSSENPKVDLHI
jgi:hypothetical protein